MNHQQLRILVLEDRATDAELMLRELRETGLRFTDKRVWTEADFLTQLRDSKPDLILADYSLPTYDGLSALAVTRKERPDVPFILVSGRLGEETAIGALQLGATDYVLKQRLSRLGPAVQRALCEAQEHKQRKQAEEALRQSESNYREVFNATHEAIFVLDAATGAILDFNQTALPMFGYSREELCHLTLNDLSSGVPPYSQQEAVQWVITASLSGPQVLEWQCTRKNGELFWSEVSLSGSSIGGKGCVLAVVRDITERKRAEARVGHLNEVLRAVRDVNELIVRERDATRLLAEACDILVRTRGYRLVWIGQVEPDSKRVIPVASAGLETDYLERITVTWDDSETGRGPIGTALHTRAPYVCQNTATDPDFAPWREPALARGYGSVAASPMLQGARLLGAITVYADHPAAFSEEEVGLLNELAADLAFALQSIEDEHERRRAESQLHDSEALYHSLVENLPQNVFRKDLSGRFTFVNQRFCELVKKPADQILGKTDYDLFDSELAKMYQADDRRIMATGQPFEAVEEHQPSGEQRIYVQVSKVPLRDAQGQISGVQGIFWDVTERNMAIDKIREQAALLDQTQDAITVHGLDGDLHYWNKGAERLYGWTPQEALSQKVDDLLYHEVSTALLEARRRVCESGEWNGELHMTTKMGRRVVVQSRWCLVRDHHRQADRILVVDTDITERKRIESQFLRAQRLESVGRLASGIAHDLNNVLAPILMAASLLRDEVTSESGRAILETIDGSAQRGADIVKQVLTFARGAEGQKGGLLPVYLMKEMAKIIRETFPKIIKLETESAENPWSVTADATQLHQVLMNLCVNARDAMPHGGTLTLGAENVWLDENYAAMIPAAKAGPHVLLTVSDTGTGIPAENLDKIFDPFYTTKGPEQGTGLGLSTALGIVKSHGGFIQVVSKVGQGSQFRVYLPATATEEASPKESPTDPLPRGQGELILVVEDEDSIRSVTSKVLELHGYRVLTASEGTEALALYAQHRDEVQLVITDLIMPFMDGPATIRAIRDMAPQAKIIATSGHGSRVTLGTQEIPSVSAFLSKPFSTAALLQTLRNVLRDDVSKHDPKPPAGDVK